MISEYLPFIGAFSLGFIITVLFTFLVRKVAIKYKIVDDPQTSSRKIHRRPIPLLGGLALYLGFVIILLYYSFFTDMVMGGYMLIKHIVGVILGGSVLIIGGVLDDRYNLKPKYQIVWPLLAALMIIASGIGITYISNPFGEAMQLDMVKWEIFMSKIIVLD